MVFLSVEAVRNTVDTLYKQVTRKRKRCSRNVRYQVRSHQPLSRCLSRLYLLSSLLSPTRPILVFRFISAPKQSSVPVLSCSVDRAWGPSRAILLFGAKAEEWLEPNIGFRFETRRNAFGWAGPSYTIHDQVTTLIFLFLILTHQHDLLRSLRINMSTVSFWDMTIDAVIRQVLRDVKRNNNQAIKGSMHTVSPIVSFHLIPS